MLATQDSIFAEAAKTIYRVTEDERVRNHCNAREMGERTYNTLVKQLDEQKLQLDEQKLQLDEQKLQLDEKKKQLDKIDQKLQKIYQEYKSKIQRKITKGKSLEQIAEELEENIEDIRPLYDELIASSTNHNYT